MPGLYRSAEEKRQLEIRNGVIQARAILHYVSEWGPNSLLTPEILKELQRLAVNQIYSCAGEFRDNEVRIAGVVHQPPPHTDVKDFVQQMCEYISQNWAMHATHLSAYVMWRVNWIHPFFGGNGRTSRAASYVVLCARLGFALPGEETIPDQIVANREPYFRALKAADAAWENGKLDVSQMEELLSSLLARQLLSIHESATGKPVLSGGDQPAENNR